MIQAPAADRPNEAAAAVPASTSTTTRVWLRDFDGTNSRRVTYEAAASLVAAGLADVVSRAGHVRLKLGIPLVHDTELHGIVAVERSRLLHGDAKTARGMRSADHPQLKRLPR